MVENPQVYTGNRPATVLQSITCIHVGKRRVCLSIKSNFRLIHHHFHFLYSNYNGLSITRFPANEWL